MADLSRIDWTAGETPVLATVLNNIGADIRTAGANRDMGGFQIVNCGGIRVVGAGAIGIGTATPSYKFNVQGGRALFQASSEAFAFGLAYDNVLGNWIWHGVNASGSWIVSDFVGNPRLSMTQAGVIKLHNTPVYADNTAAIAGGLTAGMQYRTSTGARMECY